MSLEELRARDNGLRQGWNGNSEDEQKTVGAATTCLANTETLEWQAGQIVEHARLAWFRVWKHRLEGVVQEAKTPRHARSTQGPRTGHFLVKAAWCDSRGQRTHSRPNTR